jgi:PAS domain S-box-containing protein
MSDYLKPAGSHRKNYNIFTLWVKFFLHWNRTDKLLIAFMVSISVITFVLDGYIPLGYTVWLIYFFPLYLTIWVTHGKLYWILAPLYTVLIIIQFFFGAPGIDHQAAAFNRVIGISLIWATAFLLDRRKRFESALKRSKEIVQSVNSIILTADDRGIITYINDYGLQVLGYTKTEILRRNIFEIINPAEKMTSISGETMLPHFLANPGEYRSLINETVRRNGERVWVTWSNRIMTDEEGNLTGIFAVGNDITELKISQAESEKGRSMLEGLMAYIPEVIQIVDTNHLFLYISKYHELLLGYPLQKLQGITLEERQHLIPYYHPDGTTRARLEELPSFRVLQTGEIIRNEEWRVLTAQGKLIYISIDAGPLKNHQGVVTGVVVTWHDITRQKMVITKLQQAEERERRERELLQTIINTIPVMITIYDSKIDQLFLNKYMIQVTGWTNEDPQRIHLMEAIYPDDGYRTTLTEYRQSFFPGFRDLVMKTKDGSLIDSSWASVRLPDGRQVGIGLDVRERRKAEEALKESERKFRTLSENSPDVIARFDRQSRYTYINPYGAKVYGWPRDKIIGKTNADLGVLPDKVAFWQENFEAALTGGGQRTFEFEFDSPNLGHQFFLTVFVPEKDEQGRVDSILSITRDITDLKNYQARLEQSNRELEQFAYVASHDLQEPLRIVASYTNLLERRYKEKLDAKGLGYMKYIVEGAGRMQHLIQDLLTFSRVGRVNATRSPVDTDKLVERVLNNLAQMIADAKAVVTHDRLPVLNANETNLTQLFQNLISNAIKFHKQNVPPIVHIAVKKAAGEWIFAVQDNGIGIDPRYFDKLFIIFQRLHSRDEYPGTGIGLAIAKKVVETYGRRIWVESQPEHGSTFYFSFPV